MFCPNCNAYNNEGSLVCSECGMPLIDIQKKKKKPILFISVIVGSFLAVICLVIGIIAVNNANTVKKYDKKVKTADKYISEKNYELAIEAYNEALELNDEDEEVYIRLALAYQELGDMGMVDEILSKGYQKTKSSRISNMLQTLLMYGYIYDPDGYSNEELSADSADDYEKPSEIYINEVLLSCFVDYGYQDYVSSYGNGELKRENGSDLISIYFTNPGIKIYYSNNNNNTFDTSTGIPIGNTKPSYIVLNDFETLLNGFIDNVSYDTLCSLFNSNIPILSNSNGYYVEINYMACIIQLQCDADGNISSDNKWNMIVENGAGENDLENSFDGVASGKIIDASTGYGISNVLLSFREGSNNQYGQVVEEIRTDGQGNYIAELDEGRYTVCAEADGFTTEYFEINVVKGMTLTGQNLTMSNTLGVGEIRIVLEWGANPMDLDSHLITSQGEVSYMNMSINGVASLDVDDTNGYGPETITIENSDGQYTYYVKDFTNAYEHTSSALAASGATVKVYLPGESSPRIFYVPSGDGTVWEVFSINNGSIEEINNMTYGTDELY